MRVYAFKSFEYNNSSSGGAFPTIVKAYYEETVDNLVVFGAAFDDDFSIKHFGKKYRDGIECFQQSKYVRSDISEPLRQIPILLKEGTPVLFAGTPCQVEAIQTTLKKLECNTDLLLTIDLICHGTPKSELWTDYVKLIKEKYGNVKRICFRNNEHREKGRTFLELDDGRKVYDPIEMSTFMKYFSTCMSLYKGCFNCKFRSRELNRPADFTIGDFWGVQELIPEFKGIKDVSLVIPNTAKGQHTWKAYIEKALSESLLIRECTDNRYKVFNPHLFVQTPMPKNYNKFWDDYRKLSFDDFNQKYQKVSIKYKVKTWLSGFLDKVGLKYKIKNVIWQFRNSN